VVHGVVDGIIPAEEVETTVTGTIKTKIAVLPADVPRKYRVVEIVTAIITVTVLPDPIIVVADGVAVVMVVAAAEGGIVVEAAVVAHPAAVVVVVGAMVAAAVAVHPEAVDAVRGAVAEVAVVRRAEAVAVHAEDNLISSIYTFIKAQLPVITWS
jgi:hypothetical protein